MEKSRKQAMALRFATAACAGLIGVFAVTNGVCYAATGETWVEKATVLINGEPTEMDVQMSKQGDTIVGTIETTIDDNGEDGEYTCTFIAEDVEEISIDTGSDSTAVSTMDAVVLEPEDGHVILAPDGTNVEPVDITDQIRETGGATGTFEVEGVTYVYQVSGTSGDWHVSVLTESEALGAE